jgi:hypothetical protein
MVMNLLAPSPSRMIACASSMRDGDRPPGCKTCVARRRGVGKIHAGLPGSDQDEGIIGRGIAVDGDRS